MSCIRTLATSTSPSTASPIADIVVHVHRHARSDRRARNDLQRTVRARKTVDFHNSGVCVLTVFCTREIGNNKLEPEHTQRPQCSAGLEVRYEAHHGSPRAYDDHRVQSTPIILQNSATPKQQPVSDLPPECDQVQAVRPDKPIGL